MTSSAFRICRIARGISLNRTILAESSALFAQRSNRCVAYPYAMYSSNSSNNQKRTTSSNALSTSLPKVQSWIQDANKLMAPMSKKFLLSGQSMIYRRWAAISDWYDKFSHTNEIREAHIHVEKLQEKLNEAQQLRRETSKELNDIRYQLQMCYADLANCQKGESKYLEVIRREFEIMQQEKLKTEAFTLLDKTERDLFMHLQAAVKTSHEKEKIHTNSAKYWSIIGSLVGALLGIIGTAFSYYNRHDLLSDINQEFVVIRNDTKSIEEQIKSLFNEQRKFLHKQKIRDQKMLENLSRDNVARHNQANKTAHESQESWIHWVARTTYVISIYRYFIPRAS